MQTKVPNLIFNLSWRNFLNEQFKHGIIVRKHIIHYNLIPASGIFASNLLLVDTYPLDAKVALDLK